MSAPSFWASKGYLPMQHSYCVARGQADRRRQGQIACVASAALCAGSPLNSGRGDATAPRSPQGSWALLGVRSHGEASRSAAAHRP